MSSFSQPSSFPIAYQAHYTIKQSSPSTWRLPIHPSPSHTRKPNPVITCQKFYFSQVFSHPPCPPLHTHWPYSGCYDFPTLLLENLFHGQLFPTVSVFSNTFLTVLLPLSSWSKMLILLGNSPKTFNISCPSITEPPNPHIIILQNHSETSTILSQQLGPSPLEAWHDHTSWAFVYLYMDLTAPSNFSFQILLIL